MEYSEDVRAYIDSVRSGRMTQRTTESFYRVRRRTISRKLKGKHFNWPGKPTVLLLEEKEMFVKCILIMNDFSFPIDSLI
jgi:hypothetical protein